MLLPDEDPYDLNIPSPPTDTNSSAILITFQILSWYLTSTLLYLYNKWLFSKDHDNFKFPLFTTMIHMLLQYLFAHLCLRFVFPSLKPTKHPTRNDYMYRIVPCSVATALDIGLSNSSLNSISLSFYTMVKSGGISS